MITWRYPGNEPRYRGIEEIMMMRLRRRSAGAAAAAVMAGVALLSGVTHGTATAAPAAGGPGTGVTTTFEGKMWAYHAGCAFVLSTGTIGGIDSQGYSNNWILKIDPAKPPGAPKDAPLVSCSFRGTVSSQPKKPGRPVVTNFSGDTGNVASQRRGFSGEPFSGIRPQSITVELCKGADCSGPLTHKA
ncbi:hypothetical protein [Pseudonocardia phyllosphaerae]|uniref:hypothetical protein n=1 Tax=Pseudonocardia phyllosphaerae TaxID=3390502 RepID=UPI00397AA614